MSTYAPQMNDNIGGGFGFGGGGMTWLVALVVLWILFKDGFGHNKGYGEGYGYAGKGCGCLSNCDVDRDVIKESDYTRRTEIEQGEKTRGLIVHNQERQDMKDFIAAQTVNAELKGKIAALEGKLYTDAQFAHVNSELCKVAKMAPCFVESRPVALQTCGFPQRCDRD